MSMALLVALMALIPCDNEAVWTAEMGYVRREVVEKTVENLHRTQCAGGGLIFKQIAESEPGSWAGVNVTLRGEVLQVWGDTQVIVRLRDGRQLRSRRIMADLDPCGRQILDNSLVPFVVTDRLHGYNGAVMLYVEFSEPVPWDQVESFGLE
jgi:hypothetical protein